MNNVFAVLPAYNEEINITKVMEDWKAQKESIAQYGYELKILIIDDCSSDATFDKATKVAEESDEIIIVKHSENKGLGGSIKTGISYALDNGTENDIIFTMDADFTHKAEYSVPMIESMEKKPSDVVIASRFQKNSKVFGVPKHRMILSLFAKEYYSVTLGIQNVRDYTCGYRLYKSSCLRNLKAKYGESYVSQMGFTCMVEILYKLYMAGAKFSEIPFSLHYEEKKGGSKMKVIRTTFQSLAVPFYIKKQII